MTNASIEAPWLYVARALRRKFISRFLIGIGLGLAHLLMWSQSHQDTLASKLWVAQVAMQTLFYLTIFLMVLGASLYRFRNHPIHQKIYSKVRPVLNRLTRIASTGVQLTCGFGLVAVFSGAARHAPLIVLFVLYLIAMMEVPTSLWRQQGMSKTSPFLLSILMSTPFIAGIL